MIIGRATLFVPSTDNKSEFTASGLSDQIAMSYGRLFARMLSEQDGYVTVTLESGSVRVIGLNSVTNKLTIGRLHPNYRTHLQLKKDQ